MTRVRSPGYPGCSLGQAIEITDKIFSKVRRNALDREAAVKEMGYTGLTGASAKMLSNLAHFGLVETAGKGMIRVSEIAVRALHPRSEDEKRLALYQAAFSPELFANIKANYPDGYVSEQVLRSYLKREGFAEIAIGPAVRSYLETYSFLQQSGATESHGGDIDRPSESGPTHSEKEAKSVSYPQTQPQEVAPPPIPKPVDLPLNQPNLSIRGGETVMIEALLDYEGLEQLEGKIAALKMLLKPKGN